jgi:hypothetical protein
MVGRENDLSTRVLFNTFKSYVYSQSDPEGFWIFSKNQEDINSERVDIEKVSRYLPEMGVISGQNIKISGNFLDIKLRRGIIQKVLEYWHFPSGEDVKIGCIKLERNRS